MSRNRFGTSNPKESDFELNLASIIDCFTVLMTYLLASASFISFASLDVQIPIISNSIQKSDSVPIPKVIGRIAEKGILKVEVFMSGLKTAEKEIDIKSATAVDDLRNLHAISENALEMTLIPDANVSYGEVVNVTQFSQKAMWSINLGTNVQ